MDYSLHYNRLIDRARNRSLSEYTESHHVTPRCIGGTDDPSNLVELTPEEHFVAHQLLIRIHPGIDSLVYAANMMTVNRPGNKCYGWLKRRMHQILIGRPMSIEARKQISKTMMGRKHTEQTKKKMSLAKMGRKRKPFTAEHKAKLAIALQKARASRI